MRGGRFQEGFLSAAAGHAIGDWAKDAGLNDYESTAVTVMSGGIVAELGGGKFANGAETAAFVHIFNALRGGGKQGEALAARAEKAYSDGEAYGYHDRADNFPPESYKCNKFVADMANDVGASVALNVDGNGNAWPPTAGKWGWGDPNATIPGWKIVDSPQPGDVAGQVRNYSDATGHVGIVVKGGNVISARNSGVSLDNFSDVFPSRYTKPVIFRRYVGE